MQRELEEEQSEEGNNSRTVNQAEPRLVRRNNLDDRIKKCGCKYKDFMDAKPPSQSGSPTPAEIMDWIFEMYMVFKSYDRSNRQRIVLAARQLKTGVLNWWILLAESMPKWEVGKISCKNFLKELKLQYCSKQDLL